MPIYEYACGGCKREFEAEQRITEDPLQSCPHCSSDQVKRLISKTSFVLKGGGWYSDLYASPGKDADKSSEKDSKSKSGDAADSKSDSKSDSKKTKKAATKSEGKSKSKPAKKSTG